MRHLIIISTLLIAGAMITGCNKDLNNPSENTNNTIQKTGHHFDNLEIISNKFDKIHAVNEARLAKLGINASRECVETAIVPDNYTTIQEAVDAVCAYGNVIVKPGTYNDVAVLVYKSGIHIKAIGDVILNGGFAFDDYVDDVTIQNFNIDLTTAYYEVGFGGFYNNGFDLKQNNVYGTGHVGIYFRYCNDMSINQNTVSGPMDFGIFLDGFIDGGSCYNNTIQNNFVSGMIPDQDGTGIMLRGDSDHNRIQGNSIISAIYGISFVSYYYPIGEASCDYNVVKNNVAKNNTYSGIEIYYWGGPDNMPGPGGSNNTIGPNNTSNENNFGIYLWEGSSNSHVFNNAAMNNSYCDIVNEGADNTFKNNTADCTQGVD